MERVVARLLAAGCVAPEAEAAELLSIARDEEALEALVARRERGEPLAWITARATFCDRIITVHPGVFVPRAQTEELARRAAALVPPAGRAVDLCTGCGAVGVHLLAAVPDATVIGVDVDARAVACAQANGIDALVADIEAVPLRPRSFDVVVAVAPYVPTGDLRLLPADVQRHEPRRALDGGDDGLAVVRRVVTAAARLLRPGGWLLVEVGGRQDALLVPDLSAAGFDRGRPWYDEDGDLRGLAAPLRTQRPL